MIFYLSEIIAKQIDEEEEKAISSHFKSGQMK